MNASMYKRKKPNVRSYQPGKHDCAYCRRDLTNEVRIQDIDVKLESGQFMEFCPECFAVGVEIAGFRNAQRSKVQNRPEKIPRLHEVHSLVTSHVHS